MRKRSLIVALLFVGLCGSWAAANTPVPMPTVSLQPSYLNVTINQSSDANGRDITMTANDGTVPYAGGCATPPSQFGNDYSQTAMLTYTNDTELGLMCRANTSSNSFYYAGMNPMNKYFALVKITNGTTVENLDTFVYSDFNAALSYKMELSCSGGALIATLKKSDGTLVEALTANDLSWTSGDLGAFMFKPSGSLDNPAGQWDDAMVRDPLYFMPGDANLDRSVGLSDLNLLKANWQATGVGWKEADFDGDTNVGLSDLNILKGNWQSSYSGGGAVTPEPATLGLLALGLLGLLRRR